MSVQRTAYRFPRTEAGGLSPEHVALEGYSPIEEHFLDCLHRLIYHPIAVRLLLPGCPDFRRQKISALGAAFVPASDPAHEFRGNSGTTCSAQSQRHKPSDNCAARQPRLHSGAEVLRNRIRLLRC